MLNEKQFGCSKFLSVDFIKIGKLKTKNLFYFAKRNFPPDKRHPDTGPDSGNTDHGPDMGFYGLLVNQLE
jgi:hypothetical protein